MDGVLLDEFAVKQLSHLADEGSEYLEKLLNQKASNIFSSSPNEKELSDLKKKKTQLETAVSNKGSFSLFLIALGFPEPRV